MNNEFSRDMLGFDGILVEDVYESMGDCIVGDWMRFVGFYCDEVKSFFSEVSSDICQMFAFWMALNIETEMMAFRVSVLPVWQWLWMYWVIFCVCIGSQQWYLEPQTIALNLQFGFLEISFIDWFLLFWNKMALLWIVFYLFDIACMLLFLLIHRSEFGI